ncbi:hypothetical protein V1478_007140 [Vespula squamosa]|uniref:Uncharacterized protein n=1 Tax=Vespula squamosa TaxID=30214 RepID=A0ABD2B2A8_VESSQ
MEIKIIKYILWIGIGYLQKEEEEKEENKKEQVIRSFKFRGKPVTSAEREPCHHERVLGSTKRQSGDYLVPEKKKIIWL